MDFLDDSQLIDTLPDNNTLLKGFKKLSDSKYLLAKKGKILKRRVFRYISFNNDSISYYLSSSSALPKGNLSLYRSIVVPIPSPIPDHPYCLKVISQKPSEFLIFCNDSQEQEIILLYIKLVSSNLLQQTLDKVCFNAIDQEFLFLNNLKTPKNSKIQSLITPKNVMSRFLFSPVPDDIDPYEENIAQRLPSFNLNDFSSHNTNAVQEDTMLEAFEQTETNNILKKVTENLLPEFKVLQNGSIEEIRNLGVRYLWNYQLDYARETFEQVKNQDSRSFLYLAETYLIKLLITGRKSDIKQSMQVLQSYETFLNTSSEDYSEIMQAEMMLFKSIVLAITGQKFKAFISLRNCWKTYKKYEPIMINDLDIKARIELGLGIFLLILSLVPVSISTILRLAGFSSDREKGISHLHSSFSMEQSRSVYAGLILSLYYIDLDPNPEKASEFAQEITNKYPGCVLVHWVHSIISWKNNQIDSAIGSLNRALSYCGPELGGQAAFIKYELGWLYFLRFEWSFARNQFEGILLENLSLSSDLDMLVKKLIQEGELDKSNEEKLLQIFKKPGKKDKKNWLESENTPDRVYLPHKACLITQLVSCLPVNCSSLDSWLKVIQITGMSSAHSNYDEDFAKLSIAFQNRKSNVLMPFEVIYFMKQHTKLLNYMLVKIFNTAKEVLRGVCRDNVPETCSAKMLQIMALALNGDTSLALEICEEVVGLIEKLPGYSSYLAPHSLYWCSRVMIAEGRKGEAEKLLKKAKKYKGYIFDIKCKIERVLNEMIYK